MSLLHVAAAISLKDYLKLDSVLFILSQTFSSFNTLNFLFLVQVCAWEVQDAGNYLGIISLWVTDAE